MGGFQYLYIRWDANSILTVILLRMLAKRSKSIMKVHKVAQ